MKYAIKIKQVNLRESKANHGMKIRAFFFCLMFFSVESIASQIGVNAYPQYLNAEANYQFSKAAIENTSTSSSEDPFDGVEEQYSKVKTAQNGGESIDLMRGALSYETIDAVIPGDNGLDIILSRSYGKGDEVWGFNGGLSYMLNWQFEVPRIIIHTTPLGFTQGWRIEQWDAHYTDQATARTGICNDPYPGNGPGSRWDYRKGRGNAKRYWGGMQIKIPGQNSRVLIKKTDTSARYPSDTKWVTTDDWVVSCTEDGMGFIVKSPSGLKYTMDVLQAEWRANAAIEGWEQGMNVLYASKVEDLHGNEIEYVFESLSAKWSEARYKNINENFWRKLFPEELGLLMPNFRNRLLSIKRNDTNAPVEIEVGYHPVHSALHTVTYGDRVWTYNYQTFETTICDSYEDTACETKVTRASYLDSVELPDGSYWHYGYSEDVKMYMRSSGNFVHAGPNVLNQVTTPEGAVIDYAIEYTEQKLRYEHFDQVIRLTSKTLTYDAGKTYVWSYDYKDYDDKTIKTTITSGNDKEEIVFHNNKTFKHGLVKSHKISRLGSSAYRLTEYSYAQIAEIGSYTYLDYPKDIPKSLTTKYKRTQTKVTQDGTEYLTEYLSHDDYGNPTKIKESQSVGSSVNKVKYTKLGYYYNKSNWLIGLPTTVDVATADTETLYKTVSEIVYHDSETSEGAYDGLGLPYEKKAFGRWVERYTEYSSAGNLQKVEYNVARTSGTGNRFTQFGNYKGGKAQTITVPVRDSAENMSTNQIVDGNGWINSSTDLNGITLHVEYDGNGRRIALDYENDDTYDINWDDQLETWTLDEDGQYVHQIQFCELNDDRTACSGEVKFTRTANYDGLMRMQLVSESDGITTRYKNFRYNKYNQPTFESVWSDASDEFLGTTKSYDVLQRLSHSFTSGKGGVDYEYMSGNKIKVTDDVNPAQLGRDISSIITTTTYLAYGAPDYSQPTSIVKYINSENALNKVNSVTAIGVNVYGQIETINQNGKKVDGTTLSFSETRKYDDFNQLCLVTRKDVGNTLYHYNPLGELNWKAQGVSDSVCVSEKPDSGVITYSLDNLGAIDSVTYPDDESNDLSYERDNNGNITSLTAGSVQHVYSYNNRNLLQDETLTIDTTKTLNVGYKYTSMQYRDKIIYPEGWSLHLSTDAFGRPDSIKSYEAQTAQSSEDTEAPADILRESFATSINFYPDNQLDSFIYGNNVTYKMNRNTSSLLPRRIEDKLSEVVINDLAYTYDLNGNIKSITYNNDVNSPYTISELDYDGLDRLTSVTGNASIGSSSISYDALGNITSYSSKDSSLIYTYDYVKNRLSSVSGVSGKYSSFGYDSRGNITNNGQTQFNYNQANQMYSAANNAYSYLYDGHNRRVKQTDSNGTSYSFYTQDGVLLYRESDVNESTGIGKATNYIYLGKKLIAKETEEEPYTDSRRHYKPFGETLTAQKDDVGYTGHKFDTSIGLSYMQARYYDPVIGRFYSNDPLGFRDVHSFNRYAYANNNPYKYVDPDGKEAVIQWHEVGFGFNHSLLTLYPENPDTFNNYKSYSAIGQLTNSNGRKYGTVGAGPGGLWDLTAGYNREKDVEEHTKLGSIRVKPMNGMSEDGLIKTIQKKTNNFMANTANKGLDYSFGPGLSPFEDKNSNSFISGLLESLGYDTSAMNVPNAPGWNEPVPAIWFAEPASD